jgi:hypothetical protein
VGLGRFFAMRVTVLDHMVFADEPLVAEFTPIWFGARVQAHVTTQIGFVVELFGTYLAFERFFAAMFGLVFEMFDGVGEAFTC